MADDDLFNESRDASKALDDDAGVADFLVEEHHADSDDEASGLELDDSQQKEIRLIFLTSLPQYLEPVDQMIAQIFSGQDDDQEAKKTLTTTLASIKEAADRLSIDDVSERIERVREELLLLDDDNQAEVERAIVGYLDEIKSIASGGSQAAASAASEEKAETLFVALKGAPGVDASVLQRLTKAGLVTVDQLKKARFDEIVAVTGLSAEEVETVLTALDPGAAGKPNRTAKAPSEDSAELSSLEAELERTLKTQVEEEERLGELRVDVLRTKELVEGLQQALAVAERNQDRLHETFSASCDRLADRIEVLCRARALVEDQKRDKEVQQASLARLREQVSTLGSEERRAHTEQTKLSGKVDALIESVEQMLTTRRT